MVSNLCQNNTHFFHDGSNLNDITFVDGFDVVVEIVEVDVRPDGLGYIGVEEDG